MIKSKIFWNSAESRTYEVQYTLILQEDELVIEGHGGQPVLGFAQNLANDRGSRALILIRTVSGMAGYHTPYFFYYLQAVFQYVLKFFHLLSSLLIFRIC